MLLEHQSNTSMLTRRRMFVLTLKLLCLLLPQFVHMMVDSDPGSNCKSSYQGKRLSLDLAAADQQASKAAPAATGAAAPAAAAPAVIVAQ
jgi:hypothetical protein